MSSQFLELYDIKLTRNARGIIHADYRNYINYANLVSKSYDTSSYVQDYFLDYYPQWIRSSKLNSFSGLEIYPYRYVSNGVTEAIVDFQLWARKHSRNIRTFQGEYPFTKNISAQPVGNEWIENRELTSNDAVIISCPFSATGNVHERWNEIIDTCNKLNIPVFVDCAYFGTCYNISVDLSQSCIDTVAFSTTKSFNTDSHRIGIVFTKRAKEFCTMGYMTESRYTNHFGIAMSYNLMMKFNPDTIPNVYREMQTLACVKYGLTPSNTVHLATGDKDWNYFNRDNLYNRICISNLITEFK
jgi:hypothetical protein